MRDLVVCGSLQRRSFYANKTAAQVKVENPSCLLANAYIMDLIELGPVQSDQSSGANR